MGSKCKLLIHCLKQTQSDSCRLICGSAYIQDVCGCGINMLLIFFVNTSNMPHPHVTRMHFDAGLYVTSVYSQKHRNSCLSWTNYFNFTSNDLNEMQMIV